MICADSDHDGAHIKMLIVNFFRFWFPELLHLGYVGCIKTPIVKVHFKAKNTLSFYNQEDFLDW